MVAKQQALKHMYDLISTFFHTQHSQPNRFLHFPIPHPNDYFLKIPIFFNPLFYIHHPILFLHFFLIPIFWIPALQRSPKVKFWKDLWLGSSSLAIQY
jgi:hypothetical protein